MPRLRLPASAVPFVAAASLLFCTVPSELHAQEPRTLTGVIVDADSGEPVAEVLVRIDDSGLQAVSDSAGRFRMQGVPAGSRRLVLRHVAYGEHSRVLVLDDSSVVDFRIRISRQAIELAPLEVEVRSEAELARLASGNSSNVVERPTIDEFARRGATLVNLLASEVPGIRVNGPCVEFRFQANSGSRISLEERPGFRGTGEVFDEMNRTCRELAVYLDGVRVQGSLDLRTLSIDELERVQVLSAGEAGVRFGLASGSGVILLETRQGIAPNASSPIIKITGFVWQEPRPYPWVRVLGTSFGGAAINLAVTYLGVRGCMEYDPDRASASQCEPQVAAIAGLMTGTVSSLVTTWAGKTTRSRGRHIPSLAAGVLSGVTGYMLYLKGENEGSSLSRSAGIATLTIGTPVLLTLTDRVFRQLR